MALLPLAEALVRTVYPGGISGSTIWVQHLALWVAFLGAAIAARRGELLSLTAGAQLAGARSRAWIDIVVGGISVAVCLVLLYGSLVLVYVERDGGRTIGVGLPVWIAQAIMPVGFALIGVRLLLRASPNWKGRLLAASFALVPLVLWRFEVLQETSLYLPLVVALIGATALGAPIFVGIGGVAAVLLWHDFFPVAAVPTEAYNLAIKPILPTIPLFTLAGFILAEGGTPRRLVELFTALVGWLPGGVAVVAIVVCAFFTSFTGGSGVTILAMGGLLFPMLLDRKYTPKFATGAFDVGRLAGAAVPAVARRHPLWPRREGRGPAAFRRRVHSRGPRDRDRGRVRALPGKESPDRACLVRVQTRREGVLDREVGSRDSGGRSREHPRGVCHARRGFRHHRVLRFHPRVRRPPRLEDQTGSAARRRRRGDVDRRRAHHPRRRARVDELLDLRRNPSGGGGVGADHRKLTARVPPAAQHLFADRRVLDGYLLGDRRGRPPHHSSSAWSSASTRSTSASSFSPIWSSVTSPLRWG